MPRYFFHIRKGEVLEETSKAVEVPESADLAEEATELARDLLAEGDLAGLDRREWVFEVVDEDNQPALTFPFVEALEPDLPEEQ